MPAQIVVLVVVWRVLHHGSEPRHLPTTASFGNRVRLVVLNDSHELRVRGERLVVDHRPPASPAESPVRASRQAVTVPIFDVTENSANTTNSLALALLALLVPWVETWSSSRAPVRAPTFFAPAPKNAGTTFFAFAGPAEIVEDIFDTLLAFGVFLAQEFHHILRQIVVTFAASLHFVTKILAMMALEVFC